MGTVQGFGTRFYGWRHQADGTAFATKWIAGFFLPVFPLSRFHLRVLTDFTAKEPVFVVPNEGFFAGSPIGRQVDHYELLERTPLVPGEIARTLILAYVLGPVLMAWPFGLFPLLGAILDSRPGWKESNAALYALVPLMMLTLGNAIAVPLIALRRTRGFRGGLFR